MRAPFTANIVGNNKEIGLIAIYRLPSKNIQEFLTDLENFSNAMKQADIELFIGDINIDILQKYNHDTNSYLNILNSSGFISYINKPTRITKHSKTAIDHIFIKSQTDSSKYAELEPIVFQTNITDHFALYVYISLSNHRYQHNHPITTNKIKDIDYKKLDSTIRKEKWEDILSCNNAQIAYQRFIDKLNKYIAESSFERI